MPEKSKHQLVLEAQHEQINTITDCRLGVLNALDEMEVIGGKDEYEPSIPLLLEKYNKGTTTTDRLREVYTDARLLKKTIAKLKADGKITVEEKGQTTIVSLVKTTTDKDQSGEETTGKKK